MWGFREPLDNKSQLAFIKRNVDKDVHGWSHRTGMAIIAVFVIAVVAITIALLSTPSAVPN